MKKTILISLAFVAISASTYAVTLNGVPYKLTQPLYTAETAYISAEDAADILLGELIADNQIKLGNLTMTIPADLQGVILNGALETLTYSPMVENGIYYVPVEVLDIFNVGHQFDTDLALFTPAPSSLVGETINDELFTQASYSFNELPSYLTLLGSATDITNAVNKSLTGDYTLAFVDNSAKSDVYTTFDSMLNQAPYNNIIFTYHEFNDGSLGELIRVQGNVSVNQNNLVITIGDETFECSNLITTYLPTNQDELSIEKSIDTTIMQAFYTFYRDKYNLMDDIYYSPITNTSVSQENTFSQNVHTDADGQYTINVNKIRPADYVEYVLDVVGQWGHWPLFLYKKSATVCWDCNRL